MFGDQVTNLWRDAAHPRGLWRQSSLASYLAGKPQWQTLIDVDALGKAEGRRVGSGTAPTASPRYRRCLVSLSPGGSDADVVREWDPAHARAFVEAASSSPRPKSDVTWADADTCWSAPTGARASMTTFGLPARAEALASAAPRSASADDGQGRHRRPTSQVSALSPSSTATRATYFVRQGRASMPATPGCSRPDGSLVPHPGARHCRHPGRRSAVSSSRSSTSQWGDFPAGAVVSWPMPGLSQAPCRRRGWSFSQAASKRYKAYPHHRPCDLDFACSTTSRASWLPLTCADGWKQQAAVLPDKATLATGLEP